MTGGRFLILLIIAAAGSLAAALTLSTGGSVGVATSGTTPPTTADLDWLRGAASLANAFAPTSRGEVSALLIGCLAGWVLRWIYSLPWGSVPRAIADWLLGWRTSAVMVGLAVGCTVILVFY